MKQKTRVITIVIIVLVLSMISMICMGKIIRTFDSNMKITQKEKTETITTEKEITEAETTTKEPDTTISPEEMPTSEDYTVETLDNNFVKYVYSNGAVRWFYSFGGVYYAAENGETIPEEAKVQLALKDKIQQNHEQAESEIASRREEWSIETEQKTSEEVTTTKRKQEIVYIPPEISVQEPVEQETTTQEPEANQGCKFDESTGKLTIWGEDMLYYKSTINMGVVQYIPWEYHRDQIKTVEIKDGMKEISDDAFNGCINLESVSIPSSVAIIGERAFYGCKNLNAITLPKGVTKIGVASFVDCYNLKSIVIPDGVTIIESSTFARCKNLKEVVLPATLTTIEEYAFQVCAIETIDLPDTLSSLGKGAFSYCNELKNIDFSKNLKYIPEDTYKKCNSLEEVTIPSWIESVGPCAFVSCENLKKIVFSKGVKTIDYLEAANSGITEVYIPSSVTSLEVGGLDYAYVYYVVEGSVADKYFADKGYSFGSEYKYYEDE